MNAQPSGKTTHELYKGTLEIKQSYQYLLTLPDGYEEEQKSWPLVIFLHGAGERGDQLEAVEKHGPPKLIKQGEKIPAIVVSPQCPKDQVWNQHAIADLTKNLIQSYRVDPKKVYITGLSMGGFGTWSSIIHYPELYAAAVPICGGSGVEWLIAKNAASVPVWAFHGANDSVVPPDLSRRLVQGLKAIGAEAKLTLYEGVGHDSWTVTYQDPEMWKWLFEKSKP